MLVARAKCTYEVQRGAIATTRHALKLLSSRCFGERTRRGNEPRRLCTHIEERDAFSAAWLVTLFPSFVLPFLLPFRATASPTAVRTFDMSLALPARSLRLDPSFVYSVIYPWLLLFLSPFLSLFSPPSLHYRVIHVCIHVRLLRFFAVQRPGLIFVDGCNCALYSRSEQRKPKIDSHTFNVEIIYFHVEFFKKRIILQ